MGSPEASLADEDMSLFMNENLEWNYDWAEELSKIGKGGFEALPETFFLQVLLLFEFSSPSKNEQSNKLSSSQRNKDRIF